jgi:nucleoside-diphosphate-sugar epimerase
VVTKHAFVTGATGCVGRALVERLFRSGWVVTALVRESAAALDPRARIVYGDLHSVSADDVPRDAVIFHLAGQVHMVPTDDPQRHAFFRVNRDGTARLVRIAKDVGARGFVFLSTIAVYGNRLRAGACTESDTPSPASVYGQSKLEAEHQIRENLAMSVPWTILRASVIYGPGDRGNFRRLVTAVRRGWVPLLGGGKVKKDTLYVRNLVAVIVAIGENIGVFDNKTYNVTDGTPVSMRDLVNQIATTLDMRARIVSIPTWIVRPIALMGDLVGNLVRKEMPISTRRVRVMTEDSVVDSTKIHRDLAGRVVFMSLSEGMRDYLREEGR